MNQDLVIIAEVLGGRTTAFRTLVEAYQQPVYRMLALMTTDLSAAEDLAQEVFVSVFQHLASFDPAKGAFKTWLYTIARNKARSFIEKRGRQPALLDLDSADPVVSNLAAQRAEPALGLHERLDKALAELPDIYRRVFVLSEIEELPQAEIARIEECEVGTVKSRLSRAREYLREALRDFKEAEL